MTIRDKNVDARADISPAKVGYGVGDRFFFEDFEYVSTTNVATGVPGLAVALPAAAGGVTVLQNGGVDTNGIVVWSVGDAVLDRGPVDMYTTSLWSSQRDCTLKARFPGGDMTGILEGSIGWTTGTTTADHTDTYVKVNIGDDTGLPITISVSEGGMPATTFGTGFPTTVVNVIELTLGANSKVYLRVNGTAVVLPDTITFTAGRTWRAFATIVGQSPAVRTLRNNVDYLLVSEARSDV